MDIKSADRQTQEAWNGWVNFTKAMTYVTIAGAAVLLLLFAIAL